MTSPLVLREAGVPINAFAVDDVRRTCGARMVFQSPPTEAAGQVIAVLDDTCGNRIQIYPDKTIA